MDGTFSMHEGCEKLVKYSERKRSLGRYWRRWEGKVRTNLRDIQCESVDRIQPAKARNQYQDLVSRQ